MPLTDQQRFCPLCNRAFVQGEAVLRCEGCGVMHHPGCWVTNSGCATKTTHRSVPIAQAYAEPRHVGDPAPHPGEGTRVAPFASNEAAPPRPVARPQMAAAPPALEPVIGEGTPEPQRSEPTIGAQPEEWPVIGGSPVPAQARREREPAIVRAPTPPRRYIPPEGEHQPKPMPKVYGRPSILGFWYIPVAVVLAVVVAFGVIWTSDQLFGGGGSTAAPAATPTATFTQGAATQQPSTTATASQAGSAGSPSPTRGSGTSTKFKPAEVAVVTGAGDCLNVRTKAGTDNPPIVCLNDGEEVTVTGGPEGANSLQWWQVKTKLGEGWAAEDYLVKK